MGKLETFQVSFNDNKMVYYAGDTVSGQLVIQLKSPMDMKCVKLKYVGKAHLHWTETRTVSTGKTTTTYTEHYSASESLFEQTIILLGDGLDNSKSIPQGHHVFPFSFQLPSPLPSSYEDHIGHVRYYVKGTIVKPWKFDHNTKSAFTVLDNYNLNELPNAMAPSKASESKYLCCWCCKNGPIKVDFLTERSGYVPGEWVNVSFTLKNSSSSKVKATSIHLSRRVTYRATRKTKYETKHLVTVPGPACPKKSSITINKSLQIPPLPPSELRHCSIMDIEYMITFEGHMRTCAVNLREGAPITIGTIPLMNLEIYKNMPQPVAAVPSAPGESSLPNIPQPPNVEPAAYSTMPPPPPPTYAAATEEGFNIKDDDDNEYTMGNTTYVPQYTYYNWNQSAFTYN